MKSFRTVIVITAIVVLCGIGVFGQTYQGKIVGTVLDPSNAVVPKTKITITNVATNTSRNLVTNNAGEYVAPDLEPGTYTVAAESSGFKKVQNNAVVVEVGRDVRVDFKLQP